MTITVNAVPEGTPPRVHVEVSVPAGSIMQTVAVYRTDDGVRTLIRQQPSSGFEARNVSDVEMPYDESVLYSWETVYIDPDEATEVYGESWADLTGWSGSISDASTSGGLVTVTGGGTQASITHELPNLEWDVITIESLEFLAMPIGFGHGLGFDDLILSVTSGGLLRVWSTTTTIDPTQPFTITRLSSGVLVRGAGGEASVAGATDLLTYAHISAGDSGTVRVGAITIETLGAQYTLSETADPVTVGPTEGWLIHPGKPSLSVPLSLRMDRTGVKELGEITGESTTTLHYPIGSARPIAVNSGPRLDDTIAMVLATTTREELSAVRGLLRDQTPILVRFPAAHAMEFEEGFYSVGRLSINRLAQVPGLSLRHVTLPLTATGSPIVTVQNVGWTLASVAAEFATMAELPLMFATNADLETNTRIA